MVYNTGLRRGKRLNFGGRYDAKQEQSVARLRVDSEEIEKARAYAERKLASIIEREGDCGGTRREPWYLEQLVKEAIAEIQFSRLTQECAAECEEEMVVKKDDSRLQTRTARGLAYEYAPIVPQENLNCNRRIQKCQTLYHP